MEDSGLHGQLRTKEAGRGDVGNGSLDELDNGGRLQTSEGKKANTKRGSTSGQTWEVDVGKERWWVALETMKELEDCLKKLDRGVSRKRRHWATQQKAEINKLVLGTS